MKISHKLILGFFCVALFAAAIGLFGFHAVRVIEGKFGEVVHDTVPTITALEELKFSGLRIVSSTAEYLLLKEEAPTEAENKAARVEETLIAQGRELYQDAYQRYQDLVRIERQDEELFLAKIARAGERLQNLSAELMDLKNKYLSGPVILQKKEEFEIAERHFLATIQEALAHENEELALRKASAEKAIAAALLDIQFFSIGSFILAILLGFVIAGAISAPISKLKKAAMEIERGRWDAPLALNTKDEMGYLAVSLNNMVASLRQRDSQLKAQAANLEKNLQELQAAKRDIEKLSQAKNILLANVSHELRTPLTAILGFSEIAKAHHPDQEYIAKVIHETKILLELINTLLDLACMEAGQYRLKESPYFLHKLILETFSEFKYSAEQKKITCSVAIDGGIPVAVRSDKMALRQIIGNFLSNAVKYTDHGSITLRALLVSKKDGIAHVRLEVRDTGIGVDPKMHEEVFNDFTQIDHGNDRHYGGIGIGLGLVKKIVGALQGSCGVDSEKGIPGSCFWCEIPLTEVSEESVREDSAGVEMLKSSPVFSTSAQREVSILIAEDYVPTQEILKSLFSEFRCRCRFVPNGAEAVRACRVFVFDMIFMDIQMPEMDGYTATKAIRSLKDYQDVPIVALTASADESTRDQCLQSGMNGILTKPFVREDLIRFLRANLDESFFDMSAAASSDRMQNRPWGDDSAFSESESAARDSLIFLEKLVQSFGGNKPMALRAVNAFIKAVSGQKKTVAEALSAEKYEVIQAEAHKIAGAAATLLMKELSEIARRLERAAQGKEIEQIRVLTGDLNKELSAVIEWANRQMGLK